MSKKLLSECDICSNFIFPAIESAVWHRLTKYLKDVSFINGKIYVKGRLTAGGVSKSADYILYYKPNIPIAIIESKDNKHAIGSRMQQAITQKSIVAKLRQLVKTCDQLRNSIKQSQLRNEQLLEQIKRGFGDLSYMLNYQNYQSIVIN